MTNFLLFIIICYLYCINDKLKKPNKDRKKETSIQELLPTYVGKTCEISFNKCKAAVVGILRDIDDEWIVLDCYTEKSNSKKARKEDQQTVTKIFKISIIADVKEIKRF